ncbi:MAG: hypothetical protein WC220_14160 [Pedobacter sp.]|jgi:hypothetical protein
MKQTGLLLLFTILLSSVSCSDKLNLNLLDGNYTGHYYHAGPGETKIIKSQNTISVSLSGKEYTSSGEASRIPAGGAGELNLIDKEEANFTDKHAWTADFNWNLILNGRFIYELKNDSLILTRKFEICKTCAIKPGMMPGLYQYRLMRTN